MRHFLMFNASRMVADHQRHAILNRKRVTTDFRELQRSIKVVFTIRNREQNKLGCLPSISIQ